MTFYCPLDLLCSEIPVAAALVVPLCVLLDSESITLKVMALGHSHFALFGDFSSDLVQIDIRRLKKIG